MSDQKIRLTVAKAKEICPDFAVQNGKCKSLLEGDTCELPSHFLCELSLYKRRTQQKAERYGGNALSVSRLKVLEQCPRLYQFTYDLHLQEAEPQPWKRMGDAFSVGRAKIDMGQSVDLGRLRADLLPVERAKVVAALSAYADAHARGLIPYAQGEVECEREVYFERGTVWFTGAADAVLRSGDSIFEWKFSVGDFTPIEISRQAAVYLAGVPSATKFVLCTLRKPAHRPKKEEKPAEFTERVTKALIESPDTFSFIEIERKDLRVDGIIDEMIRSWKILPQLRANGMPSSVGSHCSDCGFRIPCESVMGLTSAEVSSRLKLVT